MSGGMSDYLEGKTLNHLYGAQTFTPPATLYLALFTVTPSDTGGGTEATGTGYARLAITNNTSNFPSATGTSPTTSTNGVTFTITAAAGGTWSSGSNMVAFAYFDDPTAGNMLDWGPLTVAKPVYSGDPVSFAASTLNVTRD